MDECFKRQQSQGSVERYEKNREWMAETVIKTIEKSNEPDFDIDKFVNDTDKVREEIAKTGYESDEELIIEKIDDNHIAVTFENGVTCQYEVSENGSLTLLFGEKYDENNNLIYKLKDGVGTYIDADTGEVWLKRTYKNDGALENEFYYDGNNGITYSKSYVYNDDGSLKSTKEVYAADMTSTETTYENGSKTYEIVKDISNVANPRDLRETTWDYDNLQATIHDFTNNSTEVRQYSDDSFLIYNEATLYEGNKKIQTTYFDERQEWKQIDFYDDNGGVVDTKYRKIEALNANDEILELEYIENEQIAEIVKKALSCSVDRSEADPGNVNLSYVWGGNSLESGADCSGFVQQLYGTTLLPARTASAQASEGVHVDISDIKPGDLIFCSYGSNSIDHVVMYAGEVNGQPMIVHESNTSTGCITEPYDNFLETYNIFETRRIIE